MTAGDEAAIAAMRRIIEAADVFVVEGQSYIVAPVSAQDVDALAVFEDCDDMEPDDFNEHEDPEPNGDEWDGEHTEDDMVPPGVTCPHAAGRIPDPERVMTGPIPPIAERQDPYIGPTWNDLARANNERLARSGR